MPTQVHVFVTVFFILWFGIAFANVIAPRLVWKITQSWKAFREPPKAYFNPLKLSFALVFWNYPAVKPFLFPVRHKLLFEIRLLT